MAIVAAGARSMYSHERFVNRVAIVAGICALLFGYETGVISGALLFVKRDFSLSPWMQSVVTSTVLGGAALGAGFSGRLADRFGRRRMLIAVAVLFFLRGQPPAGLGAQRVLGWPQAAYSLAWPSASAPILPRCTLPKFLLLTTAVLWFQ